MAKKPITSEVVGKIDWLQIIFEEIGWNEVFENLLQIGLDCVTRSEAKLKHEEYDIVYSCGSIRYHTFSDETKAYHRGTLVMSGEACTVYECAMSTPDVFQELAWRIISYAMQTVSSFKVMRIDPALDDYNKPPFFTVEAVVKKVKRKQFSSHGRTDKLYDSQFDKKTRALTQVIGSGGSECMFRFYEKSKEMCRGLNGDKVDEILENAPAVRLEAEVRKDKAHSFFVAMANLPVGTDLATLIRGFIKDEITFYADSEFKNVCRWWTDYLKPCHTPLIRKVYDVANFERTLNWYEYQGGLAVTQAIYFLYSNGIDVNINPRDNKEFRWSDELVDKMTDFVTRNNRMDLIPLIQQKQRTKEGI